jgi:hypothetical protein
LLEKVPFAINTSHLQKALKFLLSQSDTSIMRNTGKARFWIFSFIAALFVVVLFQNCNSGFESVIPDINDEKNENSENGECQPGAMRSCYSGPAGTENVGLCASGVQTCNDLGSGYGPCEGEVLPTEEACDGLDHNCDGVIDSCTTVAGQCIQYKGIFFDDDWQNCLAQPSNNRSFYTGTVKWGRLNKSFLYHSIGNELEILKLDNPAQPARVARSSFRVGNQGDSDWDLYGILMCDNCRYGVAYYVLGTIYFDLGDPASAEYPRFKGWFQGQGSLTFGMTFRHGEDQYIVSRSVPTSEPCSGAAVHLMNGGRPRDYQFIQCLETPEGSEQEVNVSGGYYIGANFSSSGDAYLWTSNKAQVTTWRVTGEGAGLHVEYLRAVEGMIGLGQGNYLSYDIDLEANVNGGGVAVSLFGGKMSTWTIDRDEPDRPWLVKTIDLDLSATHVTIDFPYAFVWLGSSPNLGRTYSIVDLSAPTLLDSDFWSVNKPWNQSVCDIGEQGAVFDPGGRYLYVSRESIAQTFDLGQCSSAQSAD